jgi:hypothetical protein
VVVARSRPGLAFLLAGWLLMVAAFLRWLLLKVVVDP